MGGPKSNVIVENLNFIADVPKKSNVVFTSIILGNILEIFNSTPDAMIILREVVRLVQLLLVLPASSATAERSFSALRRLKSYLRSTITQERLNYLMLLNYHRERLENMQLEEAAQDFINGMETRVTHFGKF